MTGGGGFSSRHSVFGCAGAAQCVRGAIKMVCSFLGSGPRRRLGRAQQPDLRAVTDPDRSAQGERLACGHVKFFDNFPLVRANAAQESRLMHVKVHFDVSARHLHSRLSQGACNMLPNGANKVILMCSSM